MSNVIFVPVYALDDKVLADRPNLPFGLDFEVMMILVYITSTSSDSISSLTE